MSDSDCPFKSKNIKSKFKNSGSDKFQSWYEKKVLGSWVAGCQPGQAYISLTSEKLAMRAIAEANEIIDVMFELL